MNNDKLQIICRDYLHQLKGIASDYGLGKFIDDTIELNKQDKCHGTEEECNLMARILDEERLERKDVPKLLGKSYRRCNEDGTFKKVKTLHRVGIYSKVSALLLNDKKS
jgi:hypothetical protein